jgi:hypothetical protein
MSTHAYIVMKPCEALYKDSVWNRKHAGDVGNVGDVLHNLAQSFAVSGLIVNKGPALCVAFEVWGWLYCDELIEREVPCHMLVYTC